jgi:hypothetical protein
MDTYLPRLKLAPEARSKLMYGTHYLAGRIEDIPVQGDYGHAQSVPAGPVPEDKGLDTGQLMSKDFVELKNGSFYLFRSRIPLAHLVREFQRGESPEAIRSHYPALSLEQVYGAIAFYLGNRQEVEEDITEPEREQDAFSATHATVPEVRMIFERMREQTASRRN